MKKEYLYRGMKKNSSKLGKVYASARDVGNYAAGKVAAKHFIDYTSARLAFDTLESLQQHAFSKEAPNTQEAELQGYYDNFDFDQRLDHQIKD